VQQGLSFLKSVQPLLLVLGSRHINHYNLGTNSAVYHMISQNKQLFSNPTMSENLL